MRACVLCMRMIYVCVLLTGASLVWEGGKGGGGGIPPNNLPQPHPIGVLYGLVIPLCLVLNNRSTFFLPFWYCCPLGVLFYTHTYYCWRIGVSYYTIIQVRQLLAAVDEDQIGTHAEGAKDRVVAESKTTLVAINDAATK